MEAEIFANIKFYSTEDGGRKTDIPSNAEYYGCPFEHDGQLNDCRLLLRDFGKISPGDSLNKVPIVFLSPDLVLKKLNEGDAFTLWEGGTKAEETITKIIKRDV